MTTDRGADGTLLFPAGTAIVLTVLVPSEWGFYMSCPWER